MRDFLAWVFIQAVRGGRSRWSRERIAEVRIMLCDIDAEWRETVARMLRKLREVLRQLKDGSW